MNSKEVRKRFLDFFEKREHSIISSSSLIPENDPSVLFTTAGMQPLVPYLLGEEHPQGKRLANFQKVLRTNDIEEVGDNTHLTFFEMMGNWSLGNYFKEDAIKWSYELLTNKEEGFGLDPKRLYVTCFEGDENAPKDTESAEIWKSLGIPEERIYFLGADSNWWSPGDNGPCGPDTEMFYDVKGGLNLTSKEEFLEADDKQDVVEIWNDVFMEYKKKDGKIVGKLENKNVDTGSGFERVVAILQGKKTPYETDIFFPILEAIQKMSSKEINSFDSKENRIIADHIRASIMLIADGVLPANSDQGYILRRLIRRAIRKADAIGITPGNLISLVEVVATQYDGIYENVRSQQEHIEETISKEEDAFRRTLEDGLKQFEKISKKSDENKLSGEDAFKLFSTYGFPFELTKEIAEEKNIEVDEKGFNEELEKHQERSRTSSAGKFKGGLAGNSEMEVKYHTATHLLHAALREILGEHVVQKGSNINPDRLRFDFSHGEKMTEEEKEKVTDWVNSKIEGEGIEVTKKEMSYDEAKSLGAMGLFEDKYGDKVSVYSIGDISIELCGGPHVENTNTLGKFRIKKEEASSAGVRRIKAVLE
ncbi:alanine--tRNA ligase [Candidatus Pacebacteria bacterium]|nr:alanine--tRNA ligase [Candidatus Paceibacterota bacterium]